jgi:hypothetical protein
VKPISLAAAFPHLRAEIPIIADVAWESSFSTSDDMVMIPIARAIFRAQSNALANDLPSALEFSEAILSDIAALRTLAEDTRDRRAIKFCISSFAHSPL